MWSRLSPTQATLCALQRFFPSYVFHHYWCSRIACYAKIWCLDRLFLWSICPRPNRYWWCNQRMRWRRSKDQECKLTFYHDSQHFSPSGLPCLVTKSVNRVSPNLESASYLRLKIPQNLPCQSNSNTSPAALYLFGATYTIVLDGTPDGKLCRHTTLFCGLPFAAWFAIQSRETLRGLKPYRLKDM